MLAESTCLAPALLGVMVGLTTTSALPVWPVLPMAGVVKHLVGSVVVGMAVLCPDLVALPAVEALTACCRSCSPGAACTCGRGE
jgi:hypothetical protein